MTFNPNDTIRKDGLFACFMPKLPKSIKKTLGPMVSSKVVLRRKKLCRLDETADCEFEIRRFSSIDVEQQKWRKEVRKTWDAYDEINQMVKDQTNQTLENLRLQSQVYREEVNSLRRQIDELKFEKEVLTDQILPEAVNYRRRSHQFH
jgi:septal ring factor EnvC (AmiA/AmiB activator)